MPRTLKENLEILEVLNRTNTKDLDPIAQIAVKEMRQAYIDKIYKQLQEDPAPVATAPAAPKAPSEAIAIFPEKGPHAGGSY